MAIEGEKRAYVLFGGIASGKTTLTESLEREGARVYSLDRFFHERTIQIRSQIDRNIRILTAADKRRMLAENLKEINVYDLMPLQNVLNIIAQANASVTAIHLNISREERLSRFRERRKRQIELSRRLLKILGIPATEMDHWIMHLLFQKRKSYEKVPEHLRAEYNRLLKIWYLSGAHIFNERNPNPQDFEGIDHVVELGDEVQLDGIRVEDLNTSQIPSSEMQEEKSIA